MMVGSVMYIVGLALMATAHGMIPILIGAGVLIGISLACTANAIECRCRRVQCPQPSAAL
jgi:hypothetical protein